MEKNDAQRVNRREIFPPMPTWPMPFGAPIITDPQGSWTGVPEEGAAEPVQDVDDL